MTNEQLSEYYGFKAYDHGFFEDFGEISVTTCLRIQRRIGQMYMPKFIIELLDSKVESPAKNWRRFDLQISLIIFVV
jgi:hypothetical protein